MVADKPRDLTILGSTGSVGKSTLDLVRKDTAHFRVSVLTAFNNVECLASQIKEFSPDLAVIGDPDRYSDLKALVGESPTELASGEDALVEAGRQETDWVMAGIVGAAGLAPTLAAVERGAMIAIANKECLVCAGDLVIETAKRSGATLLPADSEHNAIFQVLEERNRESVEKLILTASGGPFRGWTVEQMRAVTREQALAHPNWDMGAKISIDSATMMNKGLEIIEAHHLFGIEEAAIETVVHPQSIIHSMVQYRDGSVLAQLGSPDMRIPIANTLAWPKRMSFTDSRLDFRSLSALEFSEPDDVAFPSLRLARQALKAGGSAPTVLNAANEIAVAYFLNEEIGFLEIAAVTEEVLQRSEICRVGALADAVAADFEARSLTHELVSARRTG